MLVNDFLCRIAKLFGNLFPDFGRDFHMVAYAAYLLPKQNRSRRIFWVQIPHTLPKNRGMKNPPKH